MLYNRKGFDRGKSDKKCQKEDKIKGCLITFGQRLSRSKATPHTYNQAFIKMSVYFITYRIKRFYYFSGLFPAQGFLAL